jgi:hypothetical protein
MNAVGDGINGMSGKHESRNFTVFLSHPIDIMAQIECQVSHVNLNVAKQTKTDMTGTLKKPCSGTF